MGFTELLTIVFILLKVFGVINWSWWLVWLPEIIAGVFYLGFILFSWITYIKINKDIKRMEKESKVRNEKFREKMNEFERRGK